jgi:nucleotide-binding universal stress UspA family protein
MHFRSRVPPPRTNPECHAALTDANTRLGAELAEAKARTAARAPAAPTPREALLASTTALAAELAEKRAETALKAKRRDIECTRQGMWEELGGGQEPAPGPPFQGATASERAVARAVRRAAAANRPTAVVLCNDEMRDRTEGLAAKLVEVQAEQALKERVKRREGVGVRGEESAEGGEQWGPDPDIPTQQLTLTTCDGRGGAAQSR